jgi:hypothetical protein
LLLAASESIRALASAASSATIILNVVEEG